LGFTTRKLLTLYNGIDLDKFTRHAATDKNKSTLFGLPDDSVILTTVAVLREPKGIQYMLRALPEILSRIPNAYYAIIGDGEYRKDLEDLTSSLGLESHVIFMSYRSDVSELLAASDVFVLPTLVDALPTVLFEAMAVGIPVIASNVGGVPEIVENNVSGLLIPPANPTVLATTCICLLQDETLAQRLASAAHDKVLSHFDIRRQAKNLIALYNEMVTENGS
jgi:glycosyltransferase involved in cell wall biosynthesis